MSEKGEDSFKDLFAYFDQNQSGKIQLKQLKQLFLTPEEVADLAIKQTKKPRKKAIQNVPKFRFVISKAMFDVIVQFLDVNGEYEDEQSLLVRFEYAGLISLLNKAKDRLRT